MRFPLGPLIAILILAAPSLAQVATERIYAAESLWGVKHQISVDRMWLTLREPWLKRPSGEGVRIAIIDTGVDASHPDLEGSVVLFRDFVGDKDGRFSEKAYDDNGHGTHIAGAMVGRGHLQLNPVSYYWMTGERGIAPDARLLVAKAMDHAGVGTDDVVARAIRWAVAPNGDFTIGADIINLSIGVEDQERPTGRGVLGATVGTQTRRAVEDAIAKGVIVVVSSGNDGKGEVSQPGDIDLVISVGAVDRDGGVTEFSSFGSRLDLVAPGVLISAVPRDLDTNDFRDDGYVGMAGTSMAAPIVSGVVALMMEAQPALRERNVEGGMETKVAHVQDVLRRSADPIPGANAKDGAGLVNAYRTLSAIDAGTGKVDLVSTAVGLLVVALPIYGLVGLYRRVKRQRPEGDSAELAGFERSGEGKDGFPPE
ncbi:MAG: S8 family serine peptidase [Euryarchaeota archaeon]|nr:S8 family serine peptidase [Euryarchaeota archaeon]